MFRKIVVGFLALLAVALLIGFVLPRTVQVSRSITINAPASEIFGVIDGFRQFERWSPWAEKDPAMKTELSGALYGVGAHYSWSGNKEVGTGSQEIIESHPYTDVKVKLQFGGFDQPSIAVFLLEPVNGQSSRQGEGEVGSTRVTWTLQSDLGGNPVWHYFGLFVDKMVGGDYERGLARLKALVETQPKVDFAALKVERVELTPLTIAAVSGNSSTDIAEIGKAIGVAYGKIGVFLKATGLKQTGAPLAITRKYDDEAKVYVFDAGIPVDRADASLPPDSSVKLIQTYAGNALKVTHKGAYTALPKTYELLDAFKHAYALQDNGDTWEQYVSDPGNTPEADLITLILVPIK